MTGIAGEVRRRMAKKRKKADAPEVCENCRWWEPIWDSGTMRDYDPARHTGAGECWRYPPTLVQVPGVEPTAEVATLQPETGVIARCGEFEMMREPRSTECFTALLRRGFFPAVSSTPA